MLRLQEEAGRTGDEEEPCAWWFLEGVHSPVRTQGRIRRSGGGNAPAREGRGGRGCVCIGNRSAHRPVRGPWQTKTIIHRAAAMQAWRWCVQHRAIRQQHSAATCVHTLERSKGDKGPPFSIRARAREETPSSPPPHPQASASWAAPRHAQDPPPQHFREARLCTHVCSALRTHAALR